MSETTVKLLEVLVGLLKAMLWPAVLVWIVLRFRPQVARLLTKLTSLKVGGSEFVFRNLTPTEQQQGLSRSVEQAIQEAAHDDENAATPRTPPSKEELKTLPTIILVAEDLVFRELEAEYGLPIRRHVAVAEDYQLTGFVTDEKRMYRAIEIRFTKAGNWSGLVGTAIRRMQQRHQEYWPADDIQITFVIVADGLSQKTIKNEKLAVQKLLESESKPIDFRTYSFAELKKKYGIAQ